MNPDNNAIAHSSTVSGSPMHPAARACIQHTWFATHVQLGKEARELKKIGKASWVHLLVDFLERQRQCCFREYLDDPICHCFDEPNNQDGLTIDVELEEAVEFFDAPSDFEIDNEIEDGVEIFDAPDER